VDQLTQEESRVGALIVDSGKKGTPIPAEDFEYLKVVGELIGAAVGKAELAEQLIESYKRKEIMVRETAHAFRNRISAIGGFSRRIAELAKDKDLAIEASLLYQEVQLLESHLEQFEKYL
jgi:signal transduction histidine kinase